MIHITPVDEPDNFGMLVREPGRRFLVRTPSPTSLQWKKHNYWGRIRDHLHEVYGCICAYSCHWIPHDTGFRTVEHFKPKEVYPNEAYEWENYRLVCGTLNGRKGTRQVLDPFQIENGWFVIKFPALLVVPSEELDCVRTQEVQSTIDCLKLNDEGTCLKSRERYVLDYCTGQFPFSHLQREAPFIAAELQRQGLVEEIKHIILI